MLNEATEDNLIDLGPGSPAVVTPRITSSPPPHSTPGATASPTLNPPTASLSSALAGLGENKIFFFLCMEKKERDFLCLNLNYQTQTPTLTTAVASPLLSGLCRPVIWEAA